MSDGKSFYEDELSEDKNLRLGSTYPPVKVFLSSVDISKLNVSEPVMRSVVLSDGKELDIEFYLETDRDIFAKDLKEAIKDAENSS